MADNFDLRFLGTVQVSRDGKPIEGFRSRKALALLGYLSVQRQLIPREQLVALFWESQTEERGRANLSWVLNRITALLPGCLRADRHAVAFHRPPEYQVDTELFDELLARGDPPALASAVELYRGEFLEGMCLDDCPEFEIWLETERERWRQRAAQALETLIAHHRRHREYDQTLRFAQRLLELAPWQESTHRLVMELLARSGQRTAALMQYESCRRMLSQELGIEPAKETVALYKRISAGSSAHRHNLPAQPTAFVGREEELTQLAGLLVSPDCRLLTILGPGGIGKTRLALRLAATQAETFLEGVCFVPLAPVNLAQHLVFAIADALQLAILDRTTPEAQLLGHLRGKQMLLVLDGLEHLLEATELLVHILQTAPEVKLLVTSRERLNLQWEWPFELGGLAYPPVASGDGQAPSLRSEQALEAYSAVSLFQRAARQVVPSFSLSGTTGGAVVGICRLVDGMPLALELAAAWVGAYTGQEIASEIERNIGFLATSRQDVPPRHRSMKAAFEQSWSLLTPPQQLAFARLAVFEGGFGSQAAMVVAEASPSDLLTLANKSLLRSLGQGRYEMHELLRQYAMEKLALQPEEWAATRDRHCFWLGAFLMQQEGRLNGPEAAEALAAVRAEIGNLRAVWRWAAMSLNSEFIERGLEGFAHFSRFTGPFFEGDTLIGVAVDEVRAKMGRQDTGLTDAGLLLCKLLAERARFLNMLGMYDRAITAAQEASDLASRESGRTIIPLATSHLQWGEAYLHQANLEAARPQLEKALALAQSSGSRQLELECLGRLADLFYQEGEVGCASDYYQRALSLSREVGDSWNEGQALDNLGIVARRQGDYDQARTYHEQALLVTRALRYRRGEAVTLNNIGLVLHCQGDGAGARACYEQALEICREAGYRQGEADVLDNLGAIALQQGDYALANACRERALHLYREIGDRQGESRALSNLGATSADEGDHSRALANLEEALRLSHETGDRRGEVGVLDRLGWTFTCLGAYGRARSRLEQALSLSQEVGDRNAQSQALSHLAFLHHCLGDNHRAREYGQQALAIGRDIGDEGSQAAALTCLGHALADLGSLDDAAAAYQDGLALRRKLGEPGRAMECLAGLARVSSAGGALSGPLSDRTGERAQGIVEELLGNLKANTLRGADEPLRVYLTCYRILNANGDARAVEVLAEARRILKEQASQIGDDELRRSFLVEVATHRELKDEAEKGLVPDKEALT